MVKRIMNFNKNCIEKLMNFTDEQLLGVEHEDGHAIFNACPGSGKTTVISSQICRLLEKGYSGKEMLVLMFGKDAQVHFTKKLASASGDSNAVMPEVLTFHALCYRLCDFFAQKGMLQAYEIEASDFKQKMMASTSLKRFYEANEWKELQTKGDKIVDLFMSFIDFIKCGSLSPRDICDSMGITGKNAKAFIAGYDEFETRRKSAKIRFFADLIYDVVNLLNANEHARAMITNRKRFIFVDEFQDINEIQYTLLKHLAGHKANVIVIGDVDQSIYMWRGSDPEFMNSYFMRDFPTAKQYGLTQTFRYGHELTIASNNVIDNNYSISKQRLISVAAKNAHETSFNIVKTEDRGCSALKIIEDAVSKGYRYDDIAVLCRLYSDNSPLELELTKAGIPCNIGKMSVFESNEFNGLMSVLRLGSGEFKSFSKQEQIKLLESLLKFPFVGLTAQQVSAMANNLVKAGFPFSKNITQSMMSFLKPFMANKMKDTIKRFDFIVANGRKVNAGDLLLAYIDESDLKSSIKNMALTELDYVETVEKIENICDFIAGFTAKPKESYDAVMSIANKRKETKEKLGEIVFNSIHKAKGLEWPVVIVANAEQGQFPYEAKGDHKIPSNIQEERRLFFVAITRAIKECYVLTPGTKNSKARHLSDGVSSIFIDESRESLSKDSAKALCMGDKGIEMLIKQNGPMKDYAVKVKALK
jgi:DNA helicase-2/ATP-dependent DNA helicase PcrA